MDCLRVVERFSRRKVKKIESDGEFERENLKFGENLGIGRSREAVFGCPIDQQELEKVIW